MKVELTELYNIKTMTKIRTRTSGIMNAPPLLLGEGGNVLLLVGNGLSEVLRRKAELELKVETALPALKALDT